MLVKFEQNLWSKLYKVMSFLTKKNASQFLTKHWRHFWKMFVWLKQLLMLNYQLSGGGHLHWKVVQGCATLKTPSGPGYSLALETHQYKFFSGSIDPISIFEKKSCIFKTQFLLIWAKFQLKKKKKKVPETLNSSKKKKSVLETLFFITLVAPTCTYPKCFAYLSWGVTG